jgi:hypothetical protein
MVLIVSAAQYDSGSEEERDGRTKLQKLNLVDKEGKDGGADEKMAEVYDGANFEKGNFPALLPPSSSFLLLSYCGFLFFLTLLTGGSHFYSRY